MPDEHEFVTLDEVTGIDDDEVDEQVELVVHELLETEVTDEYDFIDTDDEDEVEVIDVEVLVWVQELTDEVLEKIDA